MARVIEAEKVDKSDKLLKLTPVAGRYRTRAHGFKRHRQILYIPEEMIGKQVVLVKNLKPVKIRGVLSEGMILCSSDKDDTVLKIVTPGDPAQQDGDIVR